MGNDWKLDIGTTDCKVLSLQARGSCARVALLSVLAMSFLGLFEDNARWSASLSEFLQKETPSSSCQHNISLPLINLRKKVDIIVSFKEVRSSEFITSLHQLLKNLQQLLNLRRHVDKFLDEDPATSTNASTYCTKVILYCYKQLRKYLRESMERRAVVESKSLPVQRDDDGIYCEVFQVKDFLLEYGDDGNDEGISGSFEGKQLFDKKTIEEIDENQNKLKMSLVYVFICLEDICREVRMSWERLRRQECHILEPIVINTTAMHLVRKLQIEFKSKFPELECFLKDVFADIIPGGEIFSTKEAKAFLSNQTVYEFVSICTAIEQFRKDFALDKKPSRWKSFYEDSGEPLTFEPSRLVKFYETELCLLLDRLEDSFLDAFPQDSLKSNAMATSMLLFPLHDAFFSDWYHLPSIFFLWSWVTSLQCLSDPVYLYKSKTVYLYRHWRRKLNNNYYQSRLAGIMPLLDPVYVSPMSYFTFHEAYQSEDNQFFCGYNDVLYNNPLISGSLLMDMILLQRDMVQQGGDGFFALFRAVSFLYVALRQEGYLNQPIPLLDLIISAFEEQGLFQEKPKQLPTREVYFVLYLVAEGVSLDTSCAIKAALTRATQKEQIEIAKKKLKIALEVSRRKFQQHITLQNRSCSNPDGANSHSPVPNEDGHTSNNILASMERKEDSSLPHSRYRSKTLEILYERKLPMHINAISSNSRSALQKEEQANNFAEKRQAQEKDKPHINSHSSEDKMSSLASTPSHTGTSSSSSSHSNILGQNKFANNYHECTRVLQGTARIFHHEMTTTNHLSADCNLILSKLLLFFSVLVQRMPIVAEGMAGITIPSHMDVPSSSGSTNTQFSHHASQSKHASTTNQSSCNNMSSSTELRGRYLYALGDSVVTWALPLLDLAASDRTSFQEDLLRSLATSFLDILGRGNLCDPDYVDNKFCLFPEMPDTNDIFAQEFGLPLPPSNPASYASMLTATMVTKEPAPYAANSGANDASNGSTAVSVPLPLLLSFQDIILQLQRLKASASTHSIVSCLTNAASTIATTVDSANVSNKQQQQQQQQRVMQNLVWLMPTNLSDMLTQAAAALDEDDEFLDPLTKSLLPIWGRNREYHRDLDRLKQRIKQNPAVLHLRAPMSSSTAASVTYPTILHHAIQLKDLNFLEWLMCMQTYQPAIHPSVLIPPNLLLSLPDAVKQHPYHQQQLQQQQQLMAQMQQILVAYTPVQVAVQMRWKEGILAMMAYSAHRDVDVPTGPVGNTLMHEAFATGDDQVLDLLYFYDFAKYLTQENNEGLQPRDLYPPGRLAMWKTALKSKQKIPKWIEEDNLPVGIFANMATIWEQFHGLKDDPNVLEKLGTQINTIATKVNNDKKKREVMSLERQARAAALRQSASPPPLAAPPLLISSSSPLSPTVANAATTTSSSTSTYNGQDIISPDNFRHLISQNPDLLRSILHADNHSSSPPAIMNCMLEWLGVKDKIAEENSNPAAAYTSSVTTSTSMTTTTIPMTTVTSSNSSNEISDFNINNIDITIDDMGLALNDMDEDINATAMMAVAEALKSVINSEDMLYVSDVSENS